MTEPLRAVLDDRRTIHEHLLTRAMAAQDAVFSDPSVDRERLTISLHTLAMRLFLQLDALKVTGE